MSSKYARGKIAISQCDRCGMEYLLKTLKPLTIKTKITNILVCPSCWEPDQPQLQLGMYPVEDPPALRNPRPDYAGYAQSRDIQWNWNPVGGSQSFDNTLTPNYLALGVIIGTVTVQTT